MKNNTKIYGYDYFICKLMFMQNKIINILECLEEFLLPFRKREKRLCAYLSHLFLAMIKI